MGRTGVAGGQGGGCAVGASGARELRILGRLGRLAGHYRRNFWGAVEFWGSPPSRAHAPQGLGEFWGLGAAILELVLGRKEDTPPLLSVERKRNFHFLGPPQPPSSRSPRISWTGSGGCEGGCEGLRPPLKFASRYERHVPIIAAPYAFRFTENVS